MTLEENRDRYVFAYGVGGVKRWADPAAVRRALLRATNGEFDAVCLAAAKDGPEADDARGKLHAVISSAFGLPPFDPDTGEGTTEAESAALFARFADWLDGPNDEAPRGEAPQPEEPPAG